MVIIKNSNLFKTFALIFSIYIFTVSFVSCSNGEESITNSSDEVLSQINETSDNSNETSKEENNGSDEVSISPTENDIQKAFNNTFNESSFEYVFNAKLVFSDISSELNCTFKKNNGNFSSVTSILTNGAPLLQRNDFYYDEFAFLNDEMLGYSKVKCEKNEFLSYINDELFYYSPLNSISSIEYIEGEGFKSLFTEQIINESFYIALSNAVSINESIFENGTCFYTIENELIKNINADINSTAVFDNVDYPLTISFSIDFIFESELSITDTQEFNEYDSFSAFILSKSIFNLIYSDAYEVSSQSRVYLSDKEKKIYYDINSSFATSFLSERPKMSFQISLMNDELINYQHFIQDGQELKRSWKESEKKPDFTTSDSSNEYTNIKSLDIWNPVPFTLLGTSEFTVSETDLYYIIEYEYTKDLALTLINSYCTYLNNYFNDLILIDETLDNSELKIMNGSATIRKSDNIIIDHSFDISLTINNEKEIRIISSSEVISLNDDVDVINPKK